MNSPFRLGCCGDLIDTDATAARSCYEVICAELVASLVRVGAVRLGPTERSRGPTVP
ncbi:hypothetical protein GCM10011588_34110 [Nocardia jinanensis]|uniref:Uncharacterized protein n=1 Tax=Nocardia jinanensis TaxID=382504 RepID=A0A917RN47_9NOCA|nr:hypothetical protein GCM10011588_34110 [Nocardia jinanensis]